MSQINLSQTAASAVALPPSGYAAIFSPASTQLAVKDADGNVQVFSSTSPSAGVDDVNGITGSITLAASGGAQIDATGQTITIYAPAPAPSGAAVNSLAASGESPLTGAVVLAASGAIELAQSGQTITVYAPTAGSGGDPAFAIINPTSGTAPTATLGNTTLNLYAGSTAMAVSGDATTNTIAIDVNRAQWDVNAPTAFTNGALNVKAKSDTLGQHVTLESANGANAVYFNVRDNGDIFFFNPTSGLVPYNYDRAANATTFGSPVAPIYQLDISYANPSTDKYTIASQGNFGLRNFDTTDGNYSGLFFEGSTNSRTPNSAILGVNDLHNGGDSKGSLEFWTRYDSTDYNRRLQISNQGALTQTGTKRINGGESPNYQPFNANYIQLEVASSAADQIVAVREINANIDPNSSGFPFGTDGEAVYLDNNSINHQGTSDTGSISFTRNSFNIGNGTDPISVRGLGYIFGFGTINANATLTGPIQGYGFQPSLSASAVATTGCYINAFYDFSNVQTAIGPYVSYAAGPQIAQVKNNTNYSAVNLNAQIDSFEGNASYIGVAVSPTLDNFGTGGFTGISVNPTITNGNYATGLYVGMQNVSATGNVQAAYFDGDVQINGDLSFSGGLSIGQLNAYYQLALQNGTGSPVSIHSLISSFTLAASASVTASDNIGVNTASLIQIGDAASAGAGFLGIAALALPAVVAMGTGSYADLMSGAAFAVSLDPTATGGVINELDLCRSLALPNGVTSINRLVGYKMDLPFGDPGVTTWGVYVTPTVHNYLSGDLLVGGTAGSDDTVTNASVGIELKSATKSLVISRMTETERDALTAINGMIIYNTTNDRFQGYAGGTWVNFHG